MSAFIGFDVMELIIIIGMREPMLMYIIIFVSNMGVILTIYHHYLLLWESWWSKWCKYIADTISDTGIGWSTLINVIL